ncbi:hypothetical protein AADZ86_03950 [Colwelliaceae bacterium BS250]
MKYILAKIKFIFLSLGINDTWKNIKPCDVLLLKHDVNCGYIYNEKLYSPIVDSFMEYCLKANFEVQTVAKFYSTCAGHSTYGAPYSMNRIAFRDAFIGRVLSLVRGNEYGNNYRNSKLVKVWKDILEISAPRLIVAIQPEATLCQASRELNIPVYDLQHGVIGEGHPWYGGKFRKDTATKFLPNGYLCWDNASTLVINKWANIKGIHAIVIGHPWFVRFSEQSKTDQLVLEAISKKRIFKSNKPTILVTLAWGMKKYASYSNNNGVLIPSLEDVILETANKYNWLIRLHPKQIRGPEHKETQKYLIDTFGKNNESVNWTEASDLALPVILSQTNIHITYFSTVVVEASWFDIPTALLSSELLPGEKFESYYQEQRNTGIAEILAQDKDKIIHWLNEKVMDKKTENKNESLLEENAISQFIQELLSTD